MYQHIQTFFSQHNKYCINIVLKIFLYIWVDEGPHPFSCVWGAPARPKSTGPRESSLAPGWGGGDFTHVAKMSDIAGTSPGTGEKVYTKQGHLHVQLPQLLPYWIHSTKVHFVPNRQIVESCYMSNWCKKLSLSPLFSSFTTRWPFNQNHNLADGTAISPTLTLGSWGCEVAASSCILVRKGNLFLSTVVGLTHLQSLLCI